MKSSSVVKQLTHNPMIEGSNLAFGKGREKMRGSTVVEHRAHNPKIEGLNLAIGTRRE